MSSVRKIKSVMNQIRNTTVMKFHIKLVSAVAKRFIIEIIVIIFFSFLATALSDPFHFVRVHNVNVLMVLF